MSTLQDTVRTFLTTTCGCCVKDEGSAKSPASARNIGDQERLVSAAAGVLLVKLGLRHRGLSGIVGAGLGAAMIHRGYSGHCGLYEKLGVNSRKPASPSSYFDHGIHVTAAVTIDKSASELYAFWRQFENLPKFMEHLLNVTVTGEKTSRWLAKGPMGTDVRWDAEIINDVPNETIAWRSLGGAQVDNAGSVRFVEAPAGRGTEVRVNLDYIPPGRQVGRWVAKLFGEEPSQQIHQDLRRFKQLMETGVVATIDGQPKGQKQD